LRDAAPGSDRAGVRGRAPAQHDPAYRTFFPAVASYRSPTRRIPPLIAPQVPRMPRQVPRQVVRDARPSCERRRVPAFGSKAHMRPAPKPMPVKSVLKFATSPPQRSARDNTGDSCPALNAPINPRPKAVGAAPAAVRRMSIYKEDAKRVESTRGADDRCRRVVVSRWLLVVSRRSLVDGCQPVARIDG